MSIKEKAIKIAINTFLSDFDGTELDVYNRLRSEKCDEWYMIKYANVWSPFEGDQVSYVMDNLDKLVDDIVNAFGE